MNRTTFKNIAENGRAWLLTTFNKRWGFTDAQAAEDLTEHAVENDYIPPRKPVPGKTYRDWRLTGKPPLWVCCAACDLLLDDGFIPHFEEHFMILTYYWMRGHGPFDDPETALQRLPPALPADRVAQYIYAAFNTGE